MIRLLVVTTLLVGGLFGGFLNLKSHISSGAKLMQPSEVFEKVSSILEENENLKLHKVDCKIFFKKDYPYGACYGSDTTVEELAIAFKAAIDPVAFTPGWREDYGTWSGLYQLKNDSKITFGIGITPIEGNKDLEDLTGIKNYTNFVTVTIDELK